MWLPKVTRANVLKLPISRHIGERSLGCLYKTVLLYNSATCIVLLFTPTPTVSFPLIKMSLMGHSAFSPGSGSFALVRIRWRITIPDTRIYLYCIASKVDGLQHSTLVNLLSDRSALASVMAKLRRGRLGHKTPRRTER